MSNTLTHEFTLLDIDDGSMEVTVEKDGTVRLTWWDDSSDVKTVMRRLHIHREDFEQIAATVKMWDDVTTKKGLSNETAS